MDSSIVINEILGIIRSGGGLSAVLQHTCQSLTVGLGGSRCVAWLVAGDGLEATEEFSTDDKFFFKGNTIGSQESMSLVVAFLSRFVSEDSAGIINEPDISEDTTMHDCSPVMNSLLALVDVRSRLTGQLRSRGIFSGFLDLQHSGSIHKWSAADCVAFGEVITALSVVVQLIFEARKLSAEVEELRISKDLNGIFSDSKDPGDSTVAIKRAASLVASFFGFEQAEVYLHNNRDGAELLTPQISERDSPRLKLVSPMNRSHDVFFSSSDKLYNLSSDSGEFLKLRSQKEPTTSQLFGSQIAILVPIQEKERDLGVLALWRRRDGIRRWVVQDTEFALTLAQGFSRYVRTLPA